MMLVSVLERLMCAEAAARTAEHGPDAAVVEDVATAEPDRRLDA